MCITINLILDWQPNLESLAMLSHERHLIFFALLNNWHPVGFHVKETKKVYKSSHIWVTDYCEAFYTLIQTLPLWHIHTIPSPQSLVLCRHKFSFCFQLGKTPSLELQPRWPVWDSSCKLNKKATNIPCNWTPDNDNDKDNRHHIKVKTALSLFWSTDSLPR